MNLNYKRTIRLKSMEDPTTNSMFLLFEPDSELHEIAAKIPKILWDQHHKHWILPMTRESINQLFIWFKNKAWIDQTEVIKLISKHQNETSNHSIKNIGLNSENKAQIFERKNEYIISKSINTKIKNTANVEQYPALSQEIENRIEKFKYWMETKRYSPNTIENYLSSIKLYFSYNSPKLPEELTVADQERFNKNYILGNNLSYSYQNTFVSGLKCFMNYENIPFDKRIKLERPRRAKMLPQVLSIGEVKLILNRTYNIKHKAMLAIIYECGLRCGEVLSLTNHSIQADRHMLFIQAAKGKKDRYVPISEKLIEFLRKYYIQYKPLKYLFEGEKPGERYSERSLQLVLKRSVSKTGLKQKITIHTLRHCFATHHLEGGTDIRYIQHLLGHSSPKTTQIYTHVSNSALKRIPSLLDDFDL